MDYGEVSLEKEDFERFLKEMDLKKYDEEDLKTIEKMKTYFKEYFFMICNCY